MAIQFHLFTVDSEPDLEAYVVVDSFVNGRAMGGTRMTSNVNVNEVASLAHAMTLKLALAGLPIGGAKAGIRSGLPAGPERDRRLAAFGRAIAPLLRGGIYLGVDQGVTYSDRDLFLHSACFDVSEQPQVRNLPCSWSELWTHCHDITGFGICEGLDAASNSLRLNNCRTVAIQGFGAVGRAVAKGLERRGFRVVAIADYHGTIVATEGLPVQALLNATDAAGTIDRTVLSPKFHYWDTPEAWLKVDADVLVLAAGSDAINADNVHCVGTRVVVEAGNLACSAFAHRQLTEQKIPVLPAIVVNAGGAMVTGLVLSGMIPYGLDVHELIDWFYSVIAARIRRNITVLLDRVTLDPRPLSEIAVNLAAEKLSCLIQQ